ncbi:MAG: DUF1360 domain-containing protein [Nocardioidaceae bacterium]
MRSRLRHAAQQYQGHSDEHRPIRGYALAMGAYAGLAGTVVALGRRRGVRLPERMPVGDGALLGVATFRTSRLLTKAAVTSPLRAPFTRFERPGGPGEVEEEVRADGDARAFAELLTCPFCLAQWISTCFVAAYVADARRTRWAATTLAIASTSDVLQHAYSAMEQAG